MENTQILPVLNTDVLQEKATEFAMKGAIESIKDYYSGYNSPFRKAIDEQLKAKAFDHNLDLPDIIAVINESLSKEIDNIANAAIAKTFVPMVRRFLVRAEKEMNFSEILKKFIEVTDTESPDDVSIDMEKHREYNWYKLVLTHKENTYEATLHETYSTKKNPDSKKTYEFLSMPTASISRSRTASYSSYTPSAPVMKLSIDGATLEMPFTRDVLSDPFVSFIATLILADTKITLDCQDFSDEMFPEGCHCH